MKVTTVQLDPQQFRQLCERFDRIEVRLASLAGEESVEKCARCGGEEPLTATAGGDKLCATCKVVVEEVPA